MFKSEKQPKSIDFLQPVYSPTDIWSNAYIWLSEVGKYLLIAVEVVVLGVFISRFIMDKRNNDLTEEINSKVTLLSNDTWKGNAVLFDNYQSLLFDVKKIREEQEINSTAISELINGVPSSLKVKNASFSRGKVSFLFTANNLDTIKNYEAALKNNTDYHDVKFSITKDSNEINVRVTFALYEEEE